MFVRIKSCYDKELWYSEVIGNIFEVYDAPGFCYFVHPHLGILKGDCEIIVELDGKKSKRKEK